MMFATRSRKGWSIRSSGATYAGIVAAIGSVACASLSGLSGGEADAGEDGSGDAGNGHDARDAGKGHDAPEPTGGAIVVASSRLASDWCAVTVQGDVECWGNNESGELGDGTTTGSRVPVKVKGLPTPATFVTLDMATACALTRGGAAYCWGFGQDGELGNGSTTAASDTAVSVSGLDSGVTSISTGYGVTCAVKNGALLCWGSGEGHLLGTGQTSDALIPTEVPGLASGVTSVSVGDSSACAVKEGAVFCWGGFDGQGELGNDTTVGSDTPVAVIGLPPHVATVSVGGDFACALTDSGGILCWGDGTSGMLGNGQLAVSPVPVPVEGLANGVTAISAGANSVTALEADGSVVAWGYASDGELGSGSTEGDSGVGGGGGGASTIPVRVEGLTSPVIAIATGRAPCAATRAGTVECWAIVAENALVPVLVTNLGTVTSVTTGGVLSTGAFSCAASESGGISCWGGNGAGQLGNGTATSSAIPVLNEVIKVNATGVSAAAGGDFACGIGSGVAYCWGDNGSGQLGDGTTTSSKDPVGVQGLTSDVTAIAAGGMSACAMTTADAGAGGAVYCWGDNTYGQLGNGSTTPSLIPVPVTGLGAGVTALSLGVLSACALLSDGTVDCWGANQNGQLGDGTETTRLTPTKVEGISGATAVSAGWFSACAITAGALQCWGDNSFGELGDDSYNSSSTPVSVSGISSGASAVAVGVFTACAVVSGGAMCWGSGPIGNGSASALNFETPVAVTGLDQGVTAIAVTIQTACAATSGGVQCWGQNTSGELGNGGAVDVLLPTAVPGFP